MTPSIEVGNVEFLETPAMLSWSDVQAGNSLHETMSRFVFVLFLLGSLGSVVTS